MLREQMAAAAAPAGGRPAAGLRPGRDAHCGWPLSRAAVGWRCRCAGAQRMRCTGHGRRALDAHWLSTGCRQRRAHSTKERRRRLSPSRRIARRSAQVRLRGRRRPQPCQNHKFSEIADQSVLEVGAWERGHLLSRRRSRLQPQAWSCFVSATTLRLLLPAPHYPVSAVLLFRLGVDLHTSMSSLGALDRVPTRRAATQLARQKQGADESSSAPYANLIPGKEGTVVRGRCTLAATILFDSI